MPLANKRLKLQKEVDENKDTVRKLQKAELRMSESAMIRVRTLLINCLVDDVGLD
jgi:hypothetical protein